MTELKFRENLDKCSRNELIDMIVVQWKGLGDFQEQFKMTIPKYGE